MKTLLDSRPLRRFLYLACLFLTFLLHAPVASAYSCSATSPGTQNFGNVSPVSGTTYSISGTITVTCTVGLLEGLLNGSSIRACLSIGGATGTSPRTMTNGTNTLQYNLYSDAAHTQIVGSAGSSPPNPIAVDFDLGLLGIILGGTSSVPVTLYGSLPANQTGAPAGNYSQAFSGTGAVVNYIIYTGTAPSCSSAWANGGNFAFTVMASVINDCNIAATGMDFGTSGVLGAVRAATATITAQCTLNDSYSIALNSTTAGASVADRQMVLTTGGAIVHYQLYTAGTYATIWGDGTNGTSTVGAVASGTNQPYTVYGRTPIQSTPVPGRYLDTITATISY